MIGTAEMSEDVESLLPADTEARGRTVVSRSYYAAYHASLSAAARVGFSFQPGDGGTHQQLLQFLNSQSRRELKRAGIRLKHLYSRRVNADYRLDIHHAPQAADEAVEDMTAILEILSAA